MHDDLRHRLIRDTPAQDSSARDPADVADLDLQQRPTVIGMAALSPGPRPKPSRLWWGIGLTFIGLIGVALGLFVGAPGAAERYALAQLGQLEARFGVQLSADAVEWSWGGRVQVQNLRVSSGGAPIAMVRSVDLELEVSPWERKARLVAATLDGPRLELVRRADGTSNVDAVLAALKARGGGGAGGRLELGEAKLAVRDLELVIAPGLRAADLEIPREIALRRGRLELSGAAGGKQVRLDFDDTSLDPGQPFAVELAFAEDGWLTPRLGPLGRLDRVAVSPSRPVRFWMGERVVGVGGVALSREGVELFPLQLSVPVPGRVPQGEVSAAATVGRVVVGVADLARLLEPGALARLAETARSALRGAGASPVTRLQLSGPVIALSLDGARHSFEDVLGLARSLGFGDLGGAARAAGAAAELEEERVLVSSNLAAAERLVRAPRVDRATASQVRAPAPLASVITGPTARLAGGLEGLVERLSRLRDRLGAALALAGELEVRGGELELSVATPSAAEPAGRLELGLTGLDLTVARADASAALELRASADNPFGGRRVEASLRAPQSEGEPFTWSVQLDGVPVAALGAAASRFGLGSRGVLGGSLEGSASATRLEVRFDLALDGGSWSHPAVSREPLTLTGRVKGRLDLDPVTQTVLVSELSLSAGELEITGSLDILSAASAPRLKLALALADTPVQRVIDALPPELAPMLAGLQMEGHLGWDLVVDLDTTRPSGVTIDSRPRARGLRVTSLGERLDLRALRTSHAYTIRLYDGTPGTRVVGPASASWVSLAQITPYLPLAFTTTEDGTFYTNDGISTFAMKESLATNLERGAFARGASTITQQLVKNLYLGGEKTVSRKLQEIFIAWQLAQTLSKDEVMALYLNTIEFGPGIYGIGDAAWHWFGKRPIDLSLAEAVFLASIVPGPRRYYTFYEQGGITPRWASYIETLLKVMVDRRKITAEELTASLPVQIRFRGRGGGYTDEAPEDFDLVPDRDDLVEPDPNDDD